MLRVNGNPTFAGTIAGTGSTSPTGYQITLNGNCSLNHLRTRINPISLPNIAVSVNIGTVWPAVGKSGGGLALCPHNQHVPMLMRTAIVTALPQPVGTRSVTINNANQSIGDPATLCNLITTN